VVDQLPKIPLSYSIPFDLRPSLIPMELVKHADELMQYAEILLGDHQAIMRHDDRILAEDRMLKVAEVRFSPVLQVFC